MDARLYPLREILDLNTDLIANFLEDLTEEQANRRIGGANSIAFVVAHLIDARHHIAEHLGSRLDNPLAEILDQATSIDDVGTLPSIESLRTALWSIGRHLVRAMTDAAPEQLAQRVSRPYPIGGESVLDTVAFLVQHDTYHLGQLGILRRQAGLPAMSYERRTRG